MACSARLAFSLLAAGCLLAGCASTAQVSEPGKVGALYDYVRSNRDGSLPERVLVYRRAHDEIAVYKAVERCTGAAFVTATLDPATLEARSFIAGKVARDGTQDVFGRMDFDPAAARLALELTMPGGPMRDSVVVAHRPFHLYDFDLATLNIALQHMEDPRRGFSFGMPMVTVTDDPARFFRYLGRADARFAGEEARNGVRSWRFEVAGPALGDKGGPMWVDAAGRHIVDVEWGLPNHAEYRDFKLRLVGVRRGGAAEWNSILRDHYRGCPQ
jgi:hypothetical protein